MDFSDVIAADRILCGTKVRSKKHAMQIISALLAEGPTRMTAPEILASLNTTDPSHPVDKLGNGVALRHGRDKQLVRPIAAMIILAAPVDFGEADNSTDIVFAMMVGTDEDATTLNTVKELLSEPETVDLLKESESADGAFDLMSARLEPCD
jgi:PTS system nitrogen regulatory IIA component